MENFTNGNLTMKRKRYKYFSYLLTKYFWFKFMSYVLFCVLLFPWRKNSPCGKLFNLSIQASFIM